MLVVNAGTQSKDFNWISSHIAADTKLENISEKTAKIDLQGPDAPKIMNAIFSDGITNLRYFRFKHSTYRGEDVIISRTGYTGEIGFELYCPPHLAATFWHEAMEHGAVCAGLGARDTLRLEVGMPLYGHELNENRNVAQVGFDRSIDCSKKFIGHSAVCAPDAKSEILVGIRLDSKRAAREGDTVHTITEEPIGIITSGSISPSLGTAIALAYITAEHAANDTQVSIHTSRKTLSGTIASLPIYTDGTARKKMERFL
jgi:aminomethyltransferase